MASLAAGSGSFLRDFSVKITTQSYGVKDHSSSPSCAVKESAAAAGPQQCYKHHCTPNVTPVGFKRRLKKKKKMEFEKRTELVADEWMEPISTSLSQTI